MPDFPDRDDSPTVFEVGAKNSPVNESETVDESRAAIEADRPADAKPGAVSTDSKAKSEPSGETRSKTVFRPIDAEGAERIYLAEQQVGIWDARIEEAAENLKAMKASREAAVAAFRRIAREINEAAEPNLFTQPPEGDCCFDPTPLNMEFSGPFPADPPAEQDESWREVPLSDLIDLGAPKKIVDALATVGVNTMGDFNKWSQPNDQQYQKTVTNQGFKGVGPAALEKFEQALEKFWEHKNTEDAKPM
jgi:hypothetical protein